MAVNHRDSNAGVPDAVRVTMISVNVRVGKFILVANMLLFALNGSDLLGNAVAASASIELARHEEREFEGGEHKSRPLQSVRGHDVYVLHSLNGGPDASANDKLCRLLFFLAACRENGAGRVTAVVPYLAYSRKDRQTKPRDPVTTRYVAALFEASGADGVVTLDVHNIAAFQNAFRCRTVHLTARKLMAAEILRTAEQGGVPADRLCVVSPDGGGVKRAQLLQEMIEAMSGKPAGFAFMEKRRSSGVVSGSLFAGDVADRHAVIVDDMISSGGTVLRAAQACRERGAASVRVCATHGLFSEGSADVLADAAIDEFLVTDSVDRFDVPADIREQKVRVIPVAPLIAETIRRLHDGKPVGQLMEPVGPGSPDRT